MTRRTPSQAESLGDGYCSRSDGPVAFCRMMPVPVYILDIIQDVDHGGNHTEGDESPNARSQFSWIEQLSAAG